MKRCFTAAPCLFLFAHASFARAQSLSFARVDTATTPAPRSVVAADFNRDGRPDLAFAGNGRASVGILLNSGSGGFAAAADVVLGGGPFELATGDLNGDGMPDLVVANADADAVDILIGRGDGTFAPASRVAIAG